MTGIIPLYKGENITSFFAVNKLRRICGEKKAGHTGTLDPNATGVLPVALGGATRFIELLPTHKKAYKATFRTGIKTDTLDIWGTVTQTCEKVPSFDDVRAAAQKFEGEIFQLPPMYSALKKDGVRLYELARQGKEVERTPRKCNIYSLAAEPVGEFEYSLYCECSAGTYIRTLISDIGDALGSGAVMTSLVRTYACGIELSDCFTLEQLENMRLNGELEKTLITVDKILDCYPSVYVTDKQAVRFKNGGDLMCERLKGLGAFGFYRVYGSGEFLGIGEFCDGDESLKVKRVYNNL